MWPKARYWRDHRAHETAVGGAKKSRPVWINIMVTGLTERPVYVCVSLCVSQGKTQEPAPGEPGCQSQLLGAHNIYVEVSLGTGGPWAPGPITGCA